MDADRNNQAYAEVRFTAMPPLQDSMTDQGKPQSGAQMSRMQVFLKTLLVAAAVASPASAESIPARVDGYVGSWAVENKHDPISGKPSEERHRSHVDASPM
jgi:hypothetical protein